MCWSKLPGESWCTMMFWPERHSYTLSKTHKESNYPDSILMLFSPLLKSRRVKQRKRNNTIEQHKAGSWFLLVVVAVISLRLQSFSVRNVLAGHTPLLINLPLLSLKSLALCRQLRSHQIVMCVFLCCLHDFFFFPKPGLLSKAPGGYCILQEEQQGSSLSGWAA